MIEERSFRVVLETPDGLRSIDCGPNESILNAAAAQGIELPVICRQGRCLTCAGRLIQGTVEHYRPDAYFPEDKAAGFILLCRAMARSDLRILTHQEWEMRAHRLAQNLPAPYA
jgi:ferredoxin